MGMNAQFDLDIGEIKIIARKTERESFRFSCRGRDYDGFVYLEKGKGIFTEKDGSADPLHEGSLVLVRKGDVYSFLFDPGCVYITSAFLFLRDEGEMLSRLPRIQRADGAVAVALDRLLREWESHRPESYLRTRILLLSLYADLLTDEGEERDPAILAMLEFIHENFRRPFTGEEIAAACALSPSYLRQRFREAMGMSITEYRDALRIKAATEMLRSRLFSPKETAYALGYADVYHFSKVFTAKVGIPPARYAHGEGD